MRRLFKPDLIVVSLVLVTTLSLMIAPAAVGSGTGDSHEVISKLRELRNEILELPDDAFRSPCLAPNHGKALANKLGAVICMVEVGAYQGAINKLENDVKKAIEHWLTEEYAERLNEKIDEIIRLLKRLRPPHHPRFPKFAIMAFPRSLTVEQGGSNSSTIIVISLKGFSRPVNLTAAISPSTPSVVLTLNPPQVTPPKNDYATSTLTVEAAEDARVGTYTITVTATLCGCLRRSVEIPLEILPAPPPPIFNFDISAYPLSITVQQGSSNASIVTITSVTNTSQPVDLVVTSESISGITATLNPSMVIPPPNSEVISLLTIKAETNASLGNYTITVTGRSGTLQHSVNITLTVIAPPAPLIPDFYVVAYPSSLTIQEGDSDTVIILIISIGDFNKTVSLKAISEPSEGITLTFNPSEVIPQPNYAAMSILTVEVAPPKNDFAISTLTVEAAKNAEVGNHTITVTATSGLLEHSVKISLEVLPAPPPPPIFNFDISAYPPSLNVQQGGANTSLIIVTSLTQASRPVDLAVTSASIGGVNTTLNPLQVIPPPNNSAISILTVEANATATLGDHEIAVTGTSGTLQHTVLITLKVTAPPIPSIPEFHIAAFPPSLTIQAGDSDTSTIVVISVRDFNQSVNLTAKCEPSEGVTLSLNPAEVTPQPNGFATSTLTVEVNSTATLGEYEITVTGTSDGLEHTVAIPLVVTGPPLPPFPDFSLAASPTSLRVQQGGLGASSIIVTSLKGFSLPVDLKATSVAGVNLALDPPRVTPPPNGFAASTLTVSVNAATLPGEYEIIVTGKSGVLEHDAEILLKVVAEKALPKIVSVLRQPENPAYNDSVIVLAFVTDMGSGVKDVVLGYSGSVTWTNVTMTLKEGIYRASIPAFPYSTVVEYRVYASDNAGNWGAPSSLDCYTVADPYSPVIGVPSWAPNEPDANVDIAVNVTVTEPTYASGVRNVTLWFQNNTLDDWKAVPMTFRGGNWTATLGKQSDTLVEFKIEAFDGAGNSAETRIYEFQVKAPAGWPLWLILLIILIIAAAIGSAAYLLQRRRQRRKGAGAVPSTKPAPPSPPSVALARKPAEAVAPIRGYGMVSFVVPAHNEEGTISQRIADVYERAAGHAGPSEIIVVDDGSSDNTFEVAWAAVESWRRKRPNIPAKVVRHSVNLGKAEAIQTGRSKATGEIVTTVNGDESIVPSFALQSMFLA